MNRKYILFVIITSFLVLLGCSTKKNTQVTRAYHEINTRYNIYFNANEAYKERLKDKQKAGTENLSLMLDVYPTRETSELKAAAGGSFNTTVDKTTKAIKLHSIKVKPQRDPSKKKDIDYQLWLKQQEFNPFLKNAWLLLGKAEYQNEDYLQSVSTFSYITRLYKDNPEVLAEARIWMAKSYTAMGWFYEAEDVFHKIKIGASLPSELEGEYSAVYADFLIKKKEYAQAIPYLEKAIEGESDRYQKTRLKYLLGQIYANLGQKTKAYEAFERVKGMSTPYEFTFNSSIQQAALSDASNRKQIVDRLTKMSKDPKNKEYLDQIYYAIGNVYLNEKDTVEAVKNYKLAVEKSGRNGYDKSLNLVRLGDIYFEQKDYIKAQPAYSEALPLLSKKIEFYPRVALRSQVLDELVVFVKDIYLQDSLQVLSKMTNEERLKAVEKIISEQKKVDEKEKKLAREQGRVSNEVTGSTSSSMFEDNTPKVPTGAVVPNPFEDKASFYFYNNDLVVNGKQTFKQKWGNRKLEDDWRRQNKQISAFANSEMQGELLKDSESNSLKDSLTFDKYSPEFYLRQIPSTPEEIEASNLIIDNGYFNMGKIYNEKLGDYNLSIDAFETELRRFPYSKNVEEVYYQLFLLYLRLGDHTKIAYYRDLLLANYPQSIYAATLADPDFEWNMKNMHQIESDLYDQTYQAYQAGNVDVVRDNYKSMLSKYPLSSLMPKFMFLNALSYAQVQDSDGFKLALQGFLDKYPKSDVSELATAMLKEAIEGRKLASGGGVMSGMIWDLKIGESGRPETAAGVDFVSEPDDQFMIAFLYTSKKIDKNQLIYDVASYNFSKFVYQIFDLSFSQIGSIEMLQIRGFNSLDELISYVNIAFEKNSLMESLDSSIVPVPISNNNYIALVNGKSLNEYISFFKDNYSKDMPTILKYWDMQKKQEPIQEQIENKAEQEEVRQEIIVEEQFPVTVQPTVKPVGSNKSEDLDQDSQSVEVGVANILDDNQIEKGDAVINAVQDIIDNPVDGIKNLFKSTPKEKLTKEEKALLKQEEKERKDREKKKKAEEKKQRDEAERLEVARQDSINLAEKAIVDARESVIKAEKAEKENAQKAKEDARKQRQEELKAKAKSRKEELKQKEKARKEALKQREKERKEALKKKEQERKNREK